MNPEPAFDLRRDGRHCRWAAARLHH